MKNQADNKNDFSALRGSKIVLGVCSSIAIYKSADLVSKLCKLGADVKVVMTENACKLMSPRIFQTLSRNDVCASMWETSGEWKPEHISLADFAELLIVAPATANCIANFARGLAPDALSCTYLATKAPTLIAPAMNTNMWEHPAVEENIQILQKRGVDFVSPECGVLACGAEGKGRLADVDKIILAATKILEDARSK